MRSKVRAYSHEGHGPRADREAGYISATSDSTSSLANGSRSIHIGSAKRPSLANTRTREKRRKQPLAWRCGSDPASGAVSGLVGPRASGAGQHEFDPIANVYPLELALEPYT